MHHLVGCPHICVDVVSVRAADGDRPSPVHIHGRRGCGICIGELHRQQRPFLQPELIAGDHLRLCGGGGSADAEVGLVKGVVDVIRDQRPLNACVSHHMKRRLRAWGIDTHHLLAKRHQGRALGDNEIQIQRGQRVQLVAYLQVEVIGRFGIKVAQLQIGKGEAGTGGGHRAKDAGVAVVRGRTGELIAVPSIEQAVLLRPIHRDGRNAAIEHELHLGLDVVGAPQGHVVYPGFRVRRHSDALGNGCGVSPRVRHR